MEKKTQEEEYRDLYYTDFHGFDILTREHRCDGHFLGRAREYATKKMEVNREKIRTGLTTHLTLCGVAASIMPMAHFTDAAIIDHGPRGCAFHHFSKNSCFTRHDCLTTAINDRDVVMGGERKLKEAILTVIKRSDPKPGVIFVYTTCATAIIGDDVTGVAKTVEEETGIPVVPINSSGFRHKLWNASADESFCILIDRMRTAAQKNKGTINFISFYSPASHYTEFVEMKPYLKKLGIGLNAMIPARCTFKEFIDSFPRAELNVVRCSTSGLMGAEYAEKKLGMPYLRMASPMSITLTERWIRGLADFFGLKDEGEVLIKEEWEKWAGKIEDIRRRLKGKRIAIGASGRKNVSLAYLATEFGMEVIYLSPMTFGPLEHDLLKGWLKDSGQNPIMIAEPTTYDDDATLAKVKPDVGLFTCQNEFQLHRLGIPNINYVIPSYDGLIGFEGAVRFGEYLVSVLECNLFKRYADYIFRYAQCSTDDRYVENFQVPGEEDI